MRIAILALVALGTFTTLSQAQVPPPSVPTNCTGSAQRQLACMRNYVRDLERRLAAIAVPAHTHPTVPPQATSSKVCIVVNFHPGSTKYDMLALVPVPSTWQPADCNRLLGRDENRLPEDRSGFIRHVFPDGNRTYTGCLHAADRSVSIGGMANMGGPSSPPFNCGW